MVTGKKLKASRNVVSPVTNHPHQYKILSNDVIQQSIKKWKSWWKRKTAEATAGTDLEGSVPKARTVQTALAPTRETGV